jgi:hypothetical protein
LQTAPQGGSNVTKVAANWGFLVVCCGCDGDESMTKAWAVRVFAAAALAACAGGGRPASVAPSAETAPTAQSDANTALMLPRGAGDGLIVGSSESAPRLLVG